MLRITRLSHNLSALAEAHWAQGRIDLALGRAKGALDHISQSVFLLDQQGRVMMMNYAAESNFNYKFSDIRGMGFEIFLAEPHHGKYKYFFENYRTNPATATFDGSKEVIGKRKDGGTLQMKLLLQELKLQSGTNLLAVITHQEKDRVLTAAERLELPKPPDEGVGAMALEPKKSIAANNLTTLGPLHRIREVIADLEQKSRAKGTLDGLREIDILSRTLEDTLNALFTLSRLQDGSLKLEKQQFDLEGLINHAVAVLAPKAYLKGLEMVCFVQPDVPTKLIGDPERLEMLVRLMLDNALGYTQQGQVYLEVKCQQSDLYLAQLSFVVRDSGQGMPPSQTTNLVQQLRQDERTIKREEKRLGLTLRFAKEMAKLMDGQISLTSQQGAWTVLAFSAGLGRQQVEMNHIGLERNLNGISLLVLEPDEIQAKTLQKKLAYRGAQVDLTRNLEETLSRLQRSFDQRQPYQLLLVTLNEGVSLDQLAAALEPQGEKRPPMLVFVKPHQEVECPANFPADRFFTLTLPISTQEPFRRILGILEQGLAQKADQ